MDAALEKAYCISSKEPNDLSMTVANRRSCQRSKRLQTPGYVLKAQLHLVLLPLSNHWGHSIQLRVLL